MLSHAILCSLLNQRQQRHWLALNRNFQPLIWQTIKLWGNYCQWGLSATPRSWGVWFRIPTRHLILFVGWNFPVCNGWRNRAWRPLSDENSQSNWRNLSEDNETGVVLEHHWKHRINECVLCIIVPTDSKYGSGKYRRLGRQTYKKRSHDYFFSYLTSPIAFPNSKKLLLCFQLALY